MAFGFKTGDNRDSDSMEEMKISDNIGACLLLKIYEVYQVWFAQYVFFLLELSSEAKISFFVISLHFKFCFMTYTVFLLIWNNITF